MSAPQLPRIAPRRSGVEGNDTACTVSSRKKVRYPGSCHGVGDGVTVGDIEANGPQGEVLNCSTKSTNSCRGAVARQHTLSAAP